MKPTFARLVTLGLAMVLAAPPAAMAQKAGRDVPTVGVLSPQSPENNGAYSAFPEQLRQLGHRDGETVRILLRTADGKQDRLPALAAELVAAKVDVILAINTPGAHAAIQATRRIPIVMVAVGDPVGSGFVANLARPGGNVTGISNMIAQLAPKRLAVLKEAIPAATRIAVLFNPEDPVTKPQLRDAERIAPALKVEFRYFPVKTAAALPDTFKQMLMWRAEAAMWLLGQHQGFQKGSIELAASHRLPLMVGFQQNVEAGGLISYTTDSIEIYGRAAAYVDRILKGARPGDLPVEQPTKFELSVNLRTAKALGLTIPPSVLLQADHVVK